MQGQKSSFAGENYFEPNSAFLAIDIGISAEELSLLRILDRELGQKYTHEYH